MRTPTSTASKILFFSFFLISYSQLFSQTGEWTWMKGSGRYGNQVGVYGTKGVGSETTTPGGREYAMGWTDAQVIYGYLVEVCIMAEVRT